ncbi:MAG: SDR family oxidoreductase [Anaerolineae bacterium]|nr:SDR family oxidoreductase [Anaerolineae bacterium]
MSDKPYQNKAVIVTGASSGIGRALALRLADQGAWIALAARDAQRLNTLAEKCCRRSVKAIAVPTDVTDEAQCKALIERAMAEFGRLDMLINNAGIGATGLLEEFPNLTLFKRVMDVNFYGTVYCTYYAVKHLKLTQGRIVNISSLGGKAPLPYNTSYIASKHAVHGFSDSLRMELSRVGVSVTVICPYWVVTEFHERLMDKDGTPRGPQGRAIYSKKTMTADQCAAITLKAASKRKREVLMGPGWLAVWLRMIAPGLMDKITIEMVLKPAVRRAKKAQSKE